MKTTKTIQPAKRHHNKLITIEGTERGLSEGEVLKGFYRHEDRLRTFKFDLVDEAGSVGHTCVFQRDEWRVVYVH